MMDRAKLEADIAWSREHAIAFNSAWNKRFGHVLIAAEKHLATLPKTRMRETWHIEYTAWVGERIWEPRIEVCGDKVIAEARALMKWDLNDRSSCIRVTGPHMQEVPE